jgi:hypothetical protein
MNGKWLSVIALVVVAGALLTVSSCGRDQQLVSIQIQPGTETFGESNIPVSLDAGLQVQLRALGTYIHPPVTKDITNEVTWASNDTQMMTVTSTGLLTATGLSCGGTLVSATVNTNTSEGGLGSSGAIVTGYMTGNVVCDTGTGGGSGNPALSVTFTGNGAGTVGSSPSGLGTCDSPGPCITQAFTGGTTVTLTATPTPPSTSATWPTCPSPSSNVCTVNLTGNTLVTVAFN